MNLLGTTGTQHIAAEDYHTYEDYLRRPEMLLWLDAWQGFVSGGCEGWDAIFGRTLAQEFPNKKHVVIVPAKLDKVEPWWEDFDLGSIYVIYMPEDSNYRDRNIKVVSLSSGLFYCAQYPEDHGASKRSGTWMTVRIAKKAGIEPHGFIINSPEESSK